ncbi:MBL fold metallo-hydrolase [Leeuwenhoekiella aequorea]|uniref:Beta-lactamase-like protein n=1 Tax=uncultured Flavobacteriia bacterium TaxID=212695 RepID=H6REW2_9BACT|nr:beta-lactamase-like protein [uncultured Flavobacteriia bacterium]|tara:strand:+ start:5476 stop:6333 length:858 start_codon:yes stop_codon:yes gene_type:complete
MTIHAIDAGSFKLDGGAMFGVVPKTLWTRTNPADTNNMIDIGARCLLIENGDRLTLIDTGMGDKQSDKFFSYYHPWGDATLEKSLLQKGFHPNDITDVFLTHLHFDHSGGCIKWSKDGKSLLPVFKNATYWSNQDHWEWATKPNAREKASFLKENILPIQESGQLQFVDKPTSAFSATSALDFGILFVDGHTDKQMIPHIQHKDKTLVFMADLLPTAGHLPLPYVMGFDTRPLLTLGEKDSFLNEAADKNYYLWLEHDAHNPIITVEHTEKGVRLKDTFKIEDVL